MSTQFGPIRKQSAASSQNTRDISSLDLYKASISMEDCIDMDIHSPLKDLDQGGQKIPYSLAIIKEHSMINNNLSSANEGFFLKFKEELEEKKDILFKAVKKGDIEFMRTVLKAYPIPLTVRKRKYFNNTLLHEALKYCHLDICLYLIKQDIGLLNEKNNQGRTPVHYALIYIKDLFVGLLQDYLQQIDWAITDENQITYQEYVEFYKYQIDVQKKVAKAVKANLKDKKKISKNQPGPFFYLTKNSEKCYSQVISNPQLPKLRTARSHYIERPKRISSIYDAKHNIFAVETGISDFVIVSELGEGCFAKVYKVRHIPSGKIYAMKVFEKSKISHQVMKYIISQKNILMRLTHPFLINAYCFFETPSLYCYVMNCCKGTLRDILNKQKQMPQNTIKSIACELISIIGYLHQNGVIYRDLKPDNIGYDETGHITLIDFGLSKDGLIGKSFCGSYLYLPPEMITAQNYNCTVDWYMLGAVLYELSTGKTPFLASDKRQLVNKIMRQDPKPLSGLSLEMIDFINSLLEKNHANRLGAEEDCYQLMSHRWFSDIEWDSISKKRYRIHFPELTFLTPKKIINESALIYFDSKILPKTEYDFIEVPRWASVKQLH